MDRPFTGARKSQSTETSVAGVAEMKRTELEYQLNHGLHQEASRMSWEKFRALFEAEYVSGKRRDTRDRGFGCYWAARVPAQVLQKLMRHSNIRITMDYYANVDEAATAAVLNRQRNILRNSQAVDRPNAPGMDAARDDGERACG
jgi:hypothetical protein